jgi:hypothetical protein
MLDAAVAMAEAGWSIFPCHWPIRAVTCSCREGGACANIGKHPLTEHGYHNATAEVDRVVGYWRQWPNANIGAATGKINDITVLDIDPRNGGVASLAALVARHGDLPETARSRTGSGGEHIIFEYISGIRNSASKIAAGLDIRGDGGLIITPPSLHESGMRYRWLNELPPAPAPAWLTASLEKRAGSKTAAPPQKWRSLFADGAAEGGRNDAAVAMVGHLLSRRLDPFLVLDIVKLWNSERLRPPLADEKIAEIVNWACGRMLKR